MQPLNVPGDVRRPLGPLLLLEHDTGAEDLEGAGRGVESERGLIRGHPVLGLADELLDLVDIEGHADAELVPGPSTGDGIGAEHSPQPADQRRHVGLGLGRHVGPPEDVDDLVHGCHPAAMNGEELEQHPRLAAPEVTLYNDAYARRIWNLDPERVRVVFLRVPGSDSFVELFEFEGSSATPRRRARPTTAPAICACSSTTSTGCTPVCTDQGYRSRAGEVVTIEDGPHAGSKVAYLIDPDGYHVECYQKAPDAPDIVRTLQAS